MAKSATGKMVSKIGAAGGGKTYKKNRPVNYYGVLAVITVLGIASVVLARYDYQNPTASAGGTPPTIGTTWFAAASFDICGVNQSLLSPFSSSKFGFSVDKNGVIRIAPVSAADAGNHATLAQFANEYPGLVASPSQLAIPVGAGAPTASTTFHNGSLCPKQKGVPANLIGKPASIEYAYWKTFSQTAPTITTDPASIKFSNEMELTMAFLPKGVIPSRPSTAQVNAMVAANATASVTTTSLPVTPVTTTTVQTSTTTTTVASATTTTTPVTTTTQG